MRTWFETASPCLVIAEVGQNHDGSLGAAHAYIDAVALTAADAVKFQTHIADAESSPSEPWRVKFSRQDATRYDYWKRMEFTEEQWEGLARHAREKGLFFLSSPFSFEAVDMLERIGVPAWKVGAGEVGNLPMIERMAATGKPVLLSTGMSSWEEIDAAVETVRRHASPVAVLQCTSQYPCPPEKLGLNVIGEIHRRYECPAGLSDHSGAIHAGLAAAALGASLIEVHVTFSRECFGPDVPASLTTTDLGRLVEGVRFIEKALGNPVDKDAAARQFGEMRSIFGKSVVVVRDLPAGWRLLESDLGLRKPGLGIPAARLHQTVSRRLKRAVSANSFLAEEDLELASTT